MRWASVCSGIGAPEVAWSDLWGPPEFVAETDRFPAAVLAYHFSEVPNLGDFTQIGPDAGPVDLLVAGTPCQSFSIAGKRAGLDDPRGNLALEYLALARRLRPRWLVFENVPGLLSSDEGRDFGTFLGALEQCGYGWAYRVLDAQHFGVPQRRRRVFVVGYLGDWRPAAAVLFEPESLSGHPPPRREAGQGITGPVTACAGTSRKHGHGWGQQEYESGFAVTHSLRADGFDASEDGTGRGTPLVPVAFDWQSGGDCRGLDPKETAQFQRNQVSAVAFTCKDHGADAGDIAPALRAMGHDSSHANAGGQVAVGYIHPRQIRNSQSSNQVGIKPDAEVADVLTSEGPGAIMQDMAVRRLTPRECERLQGLPDDWTRIPWRGRKAEDCPDGPDGPRYKVIGNSMAVPVVRWIGQRIAACDQVLSSGARTSANPKPRTTAPLAAGER